VESIQQDLGNHAFAKAFDESIGKLFSSPILKSELVFPKR